MCLKKKGILAMVLKKRGIPDICRLYIGSILPVQQW
jgi:hypothetical protein